MAEVSDYRALLDQNLLWIPSSVPVGRSTFEDLPAAVVWLLSPRQVVACFVHAADLAPEAWGESRSVALPGITVTVEEMIDSLSKVAGEGVAARVQFEPDPFIEKIVYGWATRFTTERAEIMGFRSDERFDDVIEAFIEDDLDGEFVR